MPKAQNVLSFGFEPAFTDSVEHRIAYAPFLKRDLPASQMFLIKKGLTAFKNRYPNREVYDASQGDGGASLSPIRYEDYVAATNRFIPRERPTAYGMPEGDLQVRQMLFERYYRLPEKGTGLTLAHLLTTCGGRDGLDKWFNAIAVQTQQVGHSIVLSEAPWQSYIQAGYLNGFNFLRAPHQEGFRINPEAIRQCVEYAKAHDAPVVGLILTSPDNPSGVYFTQEELMALIYAALSCGIKYILLDLMYHLVLDPGLPRYDVAAMFKALSPKERECLTVLDGVTKCAGGSGIRHAHLLCGDLAMAQTINATASHTVFTPLSSEAVAFELYRYEDPQNHVWVRRVVDPTNQSRKLFRQQMSAWGHTFVADQGYYAFVSVQQWLSERMPTAFALSQYLTHEYGLAVIPGDVFHQPGYIRFSLANTPQITKGAMGRLQEALTSLK